MKHQRATLYVGLHSPVDPLDQAERAALVRDRAERVRVLVSQAYECATVGLVAGTWKGDAEPTLRIEHVGEADESERERARALAREIKAELQQEAVGLTFEPVTFELV
jgi:sugar phosphate isomerase/epimerase